MHSNELITFLYLIKPCAAVALAGISFFIHVRYFHIFLQLSLQALQRELEESKDAQKATLNDVLHEQNVKQGRDKYKTLKQIRSGNTKHRVDQFEAL